MTSPDTGASWPSRVLLIFAGRLLSERRGDGTKAVTGPRRAAAKSTQTRSSLNRSWISLSALAALRSPVDSSAGRACPSPSRVHTWIVGVPAVSRAKLKPDRVSPTGRQDRCRANSSGIYERHLERAVPRTVQRCLRGVLCRNLLSMMPRERKRCGPLVGSHLRRVARDTRAGPRQNAAARLARLPVATSTEAGYLPETEVV